MTASRVIVLVGAVLLVALGAAYVTDRNRAHSRIVAQRRYERTVAEPGPGGTCWDRKARRFVAVHLCTNSAGAIDSWRERKGWYEYAGASLVVLTLASAFAVPRRGKRHV